MRAPEKLPRYRAIAAGWITGRAARSCLWALFLCVAPLVAQACQDAPTVVIVGPDDRARARVAVEVAATNEQRMVGLMFRQSLKPNAGMLFVFAAPGNPSFWMKNTRIPLDLIFAGPAGQIVGIVARAEPFSERSLSVDGESQFVLEVNAGFCRRHGIGLGDKLRFEGFSPIAKD